jgi:sugar lactone lactonase YvrE
MATLTPQVLLDGIVFPEGPRWHKGKLWFSDMYGGKVMTVDVAGRSEVIATVPERPSGLGWLPDDRLLIVSMHNRRLLRLDPDGLHTVADVSALVKGDINDMVVDVQGRAYIGSVGFDLAAGESPTADGNIVLVTPDGKARVVADKMQVPNGPVITPDHKTLIVAETFGHRLTAFDIAADGSLSGRRVFADLGERTPDGICLDTEGAVWVSAVFNNEYVRVRPGGEIAQCIPLTGKLAVACMLGGEDRRTLFLLTAETTLEDLAKGKAKGWIETVQVEIPGAGIP